MHDSLQNLCIFHALDGLREGLSQFSGPSRAALIYAVTPQDPIRIYDPQGLLRGHEPKLKQLYLEDRDWARDGAQEKTDLPEEVLQQDLELSGLISFGGKSRSIRYQMWFTEHHPNICSAGPVTRWLEHATRLLSQDFACGNMLSVGTSGYVLQDCGRHAVRDHIVDARNLTMGWDTRLRIYPILEATLSISKTREEGEHPFGRLVFVEPASLETLHFLARFPSMEQPSLRDTKHIRKLLQSVEHSPNMLISDGNNILGVARGEIPEFSVIADFKGAHGLLSLPCGPVCSFSDGAFHSTNRKPNLVQLEEALLELPLDDTTRYELFKTVNHLVRSAQERKHGCALALDFSTPPLNLSGQHLTHSLDLTMPENLSLATSLAKMDGALHIGADLHLHGFACLLDGRSVPGENMARGARFNSALRFSAENEHVIVVVVSSDRPASTIQHGTELTALCEWSPVHRCLTPPPLLEDWLESSAD
jgi:hypothetical protein